MTLTPENKKYILSLKKEDLNKDFIEQTFCPHYDTNTKKIVPPKISFQDEFILKKGEYHNDADVKTNVGQYVVNVVLYSDCPNIQKELGYVAAPYTGSKIEQTEDIMAKAMLDGRVSTKEFSIYLNNIQWLN